MFNYFLLKRLVAPKANFSFNPFVLFDVQVMIRSVYFDIRSQQRMQCLLLLPLEWSNNKNSYCKNWRIPQGLLCGDHCWFLCRHAGRALQSACRHFYGFYRAPRESLPRFFRLTALLWGEVRCDIHCCLVDRGVHLVTLPQGIHTVLR